MNVVVCSLLEFHLGLEDRCVLSFNVYCKQTHEHFWIPLLCTRLFVLELNHHVEHSPNSSCCNIFEKTVEGAKERKNSLARVSVRLPPLPLLEVDNLTSP